MTFYMCMSIYFALIHSFITLPHPSSSSLSSQWITHQSLPYLHSWRTCICTHMHLCMLSLAHIYTLIQILYMRRKHAICFSESGLFLLARLSTENLSFSHFSVLENLKSKCTQYLVRSCFLVHRWSFPCILPWARRKCSVSALFVRTQSHS